MIDILFWWTGAAVWFFIATAIAGVLAAIFTWLGMILIYVKRINAVNPAWKRMKLRKRVTEWRSAFVYLAKNKPDAMQVYDTDENGKKIGGIIATVCWPGLSREECAEYEG